jgi:hypothetical protein
MRKILPNVKLSLKWKRYQKNVNKFTLGYFFPFLHIQLKRTTRYLLNKVIHMKKYYALLLLLIIIKPIYSQGLAAAEFLGFQQSPLLIGAGQIGVAIPMKDASGFYYNPAQLGYFSHENNISVFLMQQTAPWSSIGLTNTPIQTINISAGYNFKKDNNDLPISIGIGYSKSKFDFLDEINVASIYNGAIYSRNSLDCFSIGACYENILLFNIGFSLKSFNSITYVPVGRNTTGTAFDFGAMIITPISKLLFNDYQLKLPDKTIFKPKFDFTVGYALTNVGKEINYLNRIIADPIPKTARLGYTFDFGIELTAKTTKIDAIDYSFTVEAEDMLIKNDNFVREYDNSLGEFNIVKNLIELQGNQSVIVHRGHIFKLFETVIIMSGRFEGQGFNVSATNGFGISSEGIFKLLSSSTNNPVFRYITDHFVLEYYNSNTYYDDSIYKANYQGITINFRGIEL